jgi:hypothetical protein
VAARNAESNHCGFEGDDIPHSAGSPASRDHAAPWLATFRRTFTILLQANGEDVRVVQELLRHRLARIKMDVYAQALTPAKRLAQGKVVAMLRDEDKKAG